jgi:hypothetical protein
MSVVLASNVFTEIVTRIGFGMGARLAVALIASVVLLHAPSARAADLAGTWRGTVDGHEGEFTTSFSEDGYVLFEYTNNKGFVRKIPLTAPGQIQFVPPGGGFKTVAVNSVVKRPGRVSYVLDIRFERASDGYLDQCSVTEQHEYALTDQGLWVRVVSRANRYFGDRNGSTYGPQKVEVSEGVLTRVE